jgi:rare lipoprotein A (peptidoglycan hydrolase)
MRGNSMLVLALVASGAVAGVAGRRAEAEPVMAGPIELARARPTSASYTGIATFYGAAYHGQIMANGERYDMYDQSTAASNRYPLGTRLLVRRAPGSPWEATLTDAERERYYDREIVVTIKDRGEFTHELDLSQGAFTLLGRIDEGVINVNITEQPSLVHVPIRAGPTVAIPAAGSARVAQ